MKNNSLYDIEYFKKMKETHKNKCRRQRRLKIAAGVILVLIIIYIVTPISRINNIEVENNTIYPENEITKIANINPGSISILHPSFLIKANLEKSNLFKNVSVSKNLFNNVVIDVNEAKPVFYVKDNNKIIFYDENDNKITFEGEALAKQKSKVPELIDLKDDKLKKEIVNKLKELDPSVLTLISQIKHKPQKYDNQYFEFIMSGSKKIFIHASLNDIIKIGSSYHNFAANTKYECTIIEFINSESKAVVKKC